MAVIALNGAFVKRGADDSVESIGGFIRHKKTATEVAVFIYLEITLLVGYPQRASLG